MESSADILSATFGALADPVRREILARLSHENATVSELAEPFQISMPAISRHLKVLETAGLIERSVEAQWRRCSLVSNGMKPAADWIDTYRQFWEDRLDALDTYLKQTKTTGDEDNDNTNGNGNHD